MSKFNACDKFLTTKQNVQSTFLLGMHWISGSGSCLLDICRFWYPLPATAASCQIMNRIIYLFITKSCSCHLGKLQFVKKQWIWLKKEWMKIENLIVFGSCLLLIWIIIIMLLYARHVIINFCTAIIRKHSTSPLIQYYPVLAAKLVLVRFQKMPSGASLILKQLLYGYYTACCLLKTCGFLWTELWLIAYPCLQ